MRTRAGVGIATGLAAALLVGGCTGAEPLPDRSLSEVRAEESRIADLAAGEGETCRARLLRQEGGTSWAWVDCEKLATGDEPASGSSVPVRVDGDQVQRPGDGTAYGADVRKLFPNDLAKRILERDPAVLP